MIGFELIAQNLERNFKANKLHHGIIIAGKKGIGKAKAAAIIEWREINGKFQSLEDVDEVKGIGPAILEKNKALIRFDD